MEDVDTTWAASGAMSLTGHRDGPPLAPRGPVGARIAGALLALEWVLRQHGASSGLDAGLLLSSRAHHEGWTRRGATSVNGSCRLLRARDAWMAINLAREADIEAVPALIEEDCGEDVWDALMRRALEMDATQFLARAQLLGIPASVLGEAAHSPAPLLCRTFGASALARDRMRVVDLSAMWAGPLCARILGTAGAQIVKVEAWNRPDGARSGPAAFYDWLHEGHRSVALDFKSAQGIAQLHSLLARADVVIESSRPRALESLGIHAAEFLSARPGRTWVSITGYGRSSEGANRVAFGDDAAVAGGLVAYDAEGNPVFCGDAVADPLSGLFAGIAALQSIRSGGGHLLELSMSGTAAWFARCEHESEMEWDLRRAAGWWSVGKGDAWACVASARPFPCAMPAHALGSDNAALLS